MFEGQLTSSTRVGFPSEKTALALGRARGSRTGFEALSERQPSSVPTPFKHPNERRGVGGARVRRRSPLE